MNRKTPDIYCDYAAITPINPVVSKLIQAVEAKAYGNPSSLHSRGLEALDVLKKSRQKIAALLSAQEREIVFCGGGTESDNLALFGVTRPILKKKKKVHVIISAIEHHAVLNVAKELQAEGAEISYVAVDEEGLLRVKDVLASVRPDTALISIIYANNEIGTIEPIAEIAKGIRKINQERKASGLAPVLLHTDACQAAGYLDLNIQKLGVDLMTLNGSKIYGPRQFGILYVKKGLNLDPIIFGGGQERGLRSGTENVAAAAGFALALEIVQKNRAKEFTRLQKLQEYFLSLLQKEISGLQLNGPLPGNLRLPNNINISIKGMDGESMVIYLDAAGIRCSTGSACSTAFTEPSHVILAISGKSRERAKSSLRFSFGQSTSKKDIDYIVSVLKQLAAQILV
jgi:cysteine desulfurase